MKKIDIALIAFGNFRRRKLRSVLTVLGVVIGTASIVTMMSLGIALDASFTKQMGDMNSLTTVRVSPGWDNSTGQQKGDMNDELVDKLKSVDNVTGISPHIRLSGKMFAGRYQSYANIIGVDMKYAKQLGLEKLSTGTGFTEETVSSGKTIFALFGSEAPYQFSIPVRHNGGGMSLSSGGGYYYPNDPDAKRPPPELDILSEDTRLRYTFDWSYGQNNPNDTSVKKKPVLYTVHPTGILAEGNWDSSIYIDIDTAKRLKKEQIKFEADRYGNTASKKQNKQVYDEIMVFSGSLEDTVKIVADIKAMGYEAWAPAEQITQSKATMGMIQMLLGGIGSISLLVAAIGIANTMIMSIYERTREIGIMKVIGCYLKDIRTMFLVEAGFIGLFGGIVGVAISYGLSLAMNVFVKADMLQGIGLGFGGSGDSKLSVIPIWLAFIAVVFSIIVSLISGFFPARRAMKLSALEAMRT